VTVRLSVQVEAEGRASTTDAIALVVFVAVVDVLDDGGQKVK